MLIRKALLILAAVSVGFTAWADAPPSGLSVVAPANVASNVLRANGRVVNVVDGDTIDVAFELRGDKPTTVVIRFRLLADIDGRGCWAPESRTKDAEEKKLGLAAKAAMNEMALGKPCVVVLPVRSNHLIDYMTLERILAVVEVDGKSLGMQQVKAKRASTKKGGKLGE